MGKDWKKRMIRGWNYLMYALIAFAGLGAEVLIGIVIGLICIFSLAVSYFDWNGSKVVKEWIYNGWLKFIFQYIYYTFETVLVSLIMIFGQNAFESWLHN